MILDKLFYNLWLVVTEYRSPKRKLRAGYSDHCHKIGRAMCRWSYFYCRVWYRTLSLRYACIRRSGIILIPKATFFCKIPLLS